MAYERGVDLVAKAPGPAPLTFARDTPPFPFGRSGVQLTHTARAAIWRGLRAFGLGPGDRVLLPAWHCGSEVDAVLAVGCEPVFYDLDPALQADLDHVETLLARGASAVYVVHYFGFPQPIAEIAALARRHGAFVVEDLALGLYSTDAFGKPLGTRGDFAVFSLVKTLGLPDGGALWIREGRERAETTRRPPHRRILRAVKGLIGNQLRRSPRDRAVGVSVSDLNRWDRRAGFDPERDDLDCSALSAGWLALVDHERVRAARRTNYERLRLAVGSGPNVRPLLGPLPPGACPAYFPIWTCDPDAVCHALHAAKIEPVRFWRRVHPAADLTAFPKLDRLRREVIRLPIHERIGSAHIERIAAVLQTVEV